MLTEQMKAEPMAFFGNHPDHDIDFAFEAEEIEGILENQHLGHTGCGREDDYEALPRRLGVFLDYRTLDDAKLAMKVRVRALAVRNGFILGEAGYAGMPAPRAYRPEGTEHAG